MVHTDGVAKGLHPRFRAGLGSGSDGNDLASLVVPTGGANPMGHVGGGALRATAQLRQSHHAVVSAPHPLTTSGRFSLWDTHKISKLKFQFV